MKKGVLIMIAISTLIILISRDVSALTFEINMDKPGVKKFAMQYIQFNVDGKNIISKLPPTFYIISYSNDDMPVLAAQVGKTYVRSGLITYLNQLSGFGHVQSIAGVHGEKIMYNPDNPPDNKVLSSYVILNDWVLIGNKKETLYNLVKRYKNAPEMVRAEKGVSKIKNWNKSGIKVWGDNADDHLYKLFEEQKKRMMIPLLKDPKKIQYIAGAFTLTDSGEMSGSLVLKPKDLKDKKDIESDLKFIHETIRRKLAAIKTPYQGTVSSTEDSIEYKADIGNYTEAQGKLFKSGD